MLVESPLGNVFPNQEFQSIDWLDLTWDQCLRRSIRKQTRGGKLVRTLLRLRLVLRHGDILLRYAETIIAVNLLPCEVLVAEPENSIAAASVAYKLGDLHVPLEMLGSEMITLVDGPVQALFAELEIPYRVESRRFQPGLRSATAQVMLANDFELVHTR